jgi:hypothetical protein
MRRPLQQGVPEAHWPPRHRPGDWPCTAQKCGACRLPELQAMQLLACHPPAVTYTQSTITQFATPTNAVHTRVVVGLLVPLRSHDARRQAPVDVPFVAVLGALHQGLWGRGGGGGWMGWGEELQVPALSQRTPERGNTNIQAVAQAAANIPASSWAPPSASMCAAHIKRPALPRSATAPPPTPPPLLCSEPCAGPPPAGLSRRRPQSTWPARRPHTAEPASACALQADRQRCST